jgi:hypothetical protein
LPKQKREFTHRFWVRGHYKHYKDKERFCRIYKLTESELKERGYQIEEGIICKWLFPYIKGTGVLITKRYNLKMMEQ